MPKRPTPVPRCPNREHRVNGATVQAAAKAGCKACTARRAYDSRRYRYDKAIGVAGLVPGDEVRAHLRTLFDKDTGGFNGHTLEAETGITHDTISRIMCGRASVLKVTADAILAVKPRGVSLPRCSHYTSSVEAKRIARGLNAQGWTFSHIGEQFGVHRCTLGRLTMNKAVEYVSFDTLSRLRLAADKLGAFDVRDPAGLLPGMDVRCANAAKRKGWTPYRDWDLAEIGNPDARPVGDEPITGPGVLNGRLVIDPDPIGLLLVEDDRHISAVTRAEAYTFVAAALKKNPDTDLPILSATECAQRLGADTRSGQRQVARMRADVHWVTKQLDELEGRTAEEPIELPNRNSARRHALLLTALLGEPYGRGWTVEELARAIGVDSHEVAVLVTDAVEFGVQRFQPAETGECRRPSRRMASAVAHYREARSAVAA